MNTMAVQGEESSAPVGRLIRWPELQKRLAGVSRMSVWRWENAGKFPKRLTIGGFIAWDIAEVEAALVRIRDQARTPKTED